MIRQKKPSSEQPSILAASWRSLGMVMKNCRRRKILKAPPKNAGTIRGLIDPTQPRVLKTPYRGTITTGKGIIMVARVTMNKASRPFHSTLEKPKAAREQDSTVPTTPRRHIFSVL